MSESYPAQAMESPFPSDATTAQIIAKINEIAARINFDGQ